MTFFAVLRGIYSGVLIPGSTFIAYFYSRLYMLFFGVYVRVSNVPRLRVCSFLVSSR